MFKGQYPVEITIKLKDVKVTKSSKPFLADERKVVFTKIATKAKKVVSAVKNKVSKKK